MKAVERRISRLEDRRQPLSEPDLVIISLLGNRLALDEDACIQILREGGFIRATTGFVPVRLIKIPDGLNSAELKQYLLENGDKIVGPHDPS